MNNTINKIMFKMKTISKVYLYKRRKNYSIESVKSSRTLRHWRERWRLKWKQIGNWCI